LIVTDWDEVPPALVAWHVRVVPVVSVLMVVELQPLVDETVDSGSLTVQLTVTSLMYQPFVPNVPLMLGVMTGGVESQLPVIWTLGCEPERVKSAGRENGAADAAADVHV
jgi:hypothetical protein